MLQNATWQQRAPATTSSSARVGAIAHEQVLLIVITVLGAVLRLQSLTVKSLWYDEIISISISRHPVMEIVRARLRFGASDRAIDELYTNNPPFHLMLLHLMSLVSTADWAMRLPFAIAGIVSIPVAFAVVRRLLGPGTALITALLFALSPLHLAYSQEARPTAFLVLFSLCGLFYLLRAVDEERRLDWGLFALFALLNVWNSYFGLILILPTYGLIFLTLVFARYRRGGWPAIKTFVAPVIAFGVIGIGTLPLLRDVLAVARMNGAEVENHGFDPLNVLVSWWNLTMLANPLPNDIWPSLAIALLVTIGCGAMIWKRGIGAWIVLIWSIVPVVILLAIDSSHVFNLRYVLASMPMVVAMTLTGLQALLPQRCVATWPMAVRAATIVVVGSLVMLSVSGVRAYERDFIWTGPIKPDWRATVQAYQAQATGQSCLITIDSLGNAFSGVIPYYGDVAGDQPFCTVDARDPRLLEITATHTDLWFAISPQWNSLDQRTRFVDAYTGEPDARDFSLIVLIHRPAGSEGAISQTIEETLTQALALLEPDDCRGTFPAPMIRESLANLNILLDRNPVATAGLLAGFEPPMGSNDELMWERAQARFVRGEIEGARTIAVRLVGLYPGDPQVYAFMAEVQRALGEPAADSFAKIAVALDAQVAPPTPHKGDLTPCGRVR